MTADHTPKTEDILEAWTEMSGWDLSLKESDKAFARWLRNLKAEAWQEGYADGRFNGAPIVDNPYL